MGSSGIRCWWRMRHAATGTLLCGPQKETQIHRICAGLTFSAAGKVIRASTTRASLCCLGDVDLSCGEAPTSLMHLFTWTANFLNALQVAPLVLSACKSWFGAEKFGGVENVRFES